MYCRYCGNKLNEDDIFCRKCGERVEGGFVPSFRRETEEEKPRNQKKKYTFDEFNWDVEGYPTSQKKNKTEEVDFKWESVDDLSQSIVSIAKNAEEEEETSLEEQIFGSDYIPEPAEPTRVAFRKKDGFEEKLTPKPAEQEAETVVTKPVADTEIETPDQTPEKEPVASIVKPEKFYTFNQKREEFQALLDQEYEKLKNNERTIIKDEIKEPAKEEELFAAKDEKDFAIPDIEKEIEAQAKPKVDETDGYVRVTLSEVPRTVMADPDIFFPSKAGESLEEKTKLTFSDVFNDDDDDTEFDEKKTKEKKQKKGGSDKKLKVIAIILCILIAVELTMIGVQYFAPDSAIGQALSSGYEYILNLFLPNNG